jgi:3,4-dihydroxy-9,10-secoandrosta-1,3,5(10)-triene-9,17-dione 4,5-dioxygenase
MISFYMRSPSNFDVEYGYGGAVVDWSEHVAHEFTRVSLWGHDFSVSQASSGRQERLSFNGKQTNERRPSRGAN